MHELAQLPHTRMLARSSLYRSAALGPGRQDDYINAVVKLATVLTPWQLLLELQALERDHGRVRNQRWAPRTLDLDILLYGQLRIDEENLCIPHAQMYQRNFVLCPLLEIEPDLILPDHTRLADKLAACPAGRLVKLPEAERHSRTTCAPGAPLNKSCIDALLLIINPHHCCTPVLAVAARYCEPAGIGYSPSNQQFSRDGSRTINFSPQFLPHVLVYE